MLVAHRIRRLVSRQAAFLGALVLGFGLLIPVSAWADGDGPSPGDTVTGTLTRVWTEHKDPRVEAQHGQNDLLTFVRTKDGDAVRLPTPQVQRLAAGASVAVTVGQPVVDSPAAQDGLDPARQVVSAKVIAPAPGAAAPAPGPSAGGTPVTDQVTVVMAVPLGASQDSTTLQQVVDQINGPVANFWSAQSGGAIHLAVTAQYNWFRATVDCSDPYALWNQAASVAGNWTRGTGKHLLVYLPGNSVSHGCAYGLGEVGYLGFGGLTYVTAPQPSVIAHELGHNFGLNHSSELQCDGVVEGGTCRTTSYYDLYDVMGASWNQMGSLNVAQSAVLGFLPSGQQQVLTDTDAATTVSLAPVSGTTGTRAIRMTTPDGTVYWLEYRPASGQDSWLDPANPPDTREGLAPGVLLRRWTTTDDTPGDGSLLFDGTPSGQSNWSTDSLQPLPVGTPVQFAGGAFTVTVTAQGTDATVDVVPADPLAAEYTATGGATGPLGAATSAQACSSRICSENFEHGAIYWSIAAGAHAVLEPMLSLWQSAGGPTGSLGMPTADTVCGLAGGGCGQDFQTGAFYWSSSTGAHKVGTAYLSAWGADREHGVLGYPVGDLGCGLARGGCSQAFQTGRIYSTSSTGAHAVSGDLLTAWANRGYEAGALGYPTGDQVCGLAGGGCQQAFQGGTLYFSAASGAQVVSGVFAAAYAGAGGPGGLLGFPITPTYCGLQRGGCVQAFQTGRIFTSPGNGTHAVSGPIQDAWIAQGLERGALGYPAGEQVCGLTGGGCAQAFEGGTLYSSTATGTRAVSGVFAAAYAGAGGQGGVLGFPTTDVFCGLIGGGCAQAFQGGRIFTSPAVGIHAVSGAVQDVWVAQGLERGPLGYPITGQFCGLRDGGCGQAFQGGRIFTDPTAGTHAVTGAIQAVWIAQGLERGALGYPTGDQVCGLAGGGCTQAFQGGSVYAGPSTGAQQLTGTIAAAFQAAGAQAGSLGYPITGAYCGLRDGGCVQAFQHGRISSSPATGAHGVTGVIQNVWIAQGLERGVLGYPTGDAVCGLAGGGCSQAFQGGSIYSGPSTGAQQLTGSIAAAFQAAGAEAGALGYPITGAYCGLHDGGCVQAFQYGRISGSPATGAHAVTGPIQDAWIAQGLERGVLGYPTGDAVCGLAGGGCSQAFQGGSIYSSPSTGAQQLTGTIATAYQAAGAETGALGYPITGAYCGLRDGGCVQAFQNGRISGSPATGAHAVTGAIQDAWIAQGLERGVLGYPTGDAQPVTGGTAQTFQGGTLTVDSQGVVTRS